MRTKSWIFLLFLILLLASCNMPVAKEPAGADPSVDVIATAVELTTAAKLTELAGPSDIKAADVPVSDTTMVPSPTSSFTPSPTSSITPSPTLSPTPCVGLVTASTVANIRSGPGTAYDVVGSLALGGTAKVVGRNDANTWWYIEYSGGSGGHAWIAGSVTTASCLPSVVQVIAAPPLPTAEPTMTEDTTSSSSSGADLAVSEFTISPSTPIKGQNTHVQIVVVNHGDKVASQFTVQWFGLSSFSNPSCSWDVMDIIPPSGSKTLQCDFIFSSYYPINKTSLVVVDVSNHVQESNEGNNQAAISPFGVNKP